METIKNYLEAMFANLPNTEQVRKAKSELLQMMEDKYNELIEDGITENAAVGTVISEFGNLDELAEELGIREEVFPVDVTPQVVRRFVSMDEAKDYVSDSVSKGLRVAIGVMLCIMCVTGVMISEILKASDTVGILLMFGMMAIGISLFIYSGVVFSKWNFVKKEACQIDINTASYLSDELEHYMGAHALRLTIGIVLCAICWLPAAVFGEIRALDELGGVLLFVMVSVGVFLIIYTSSIKSAYESLLRLNDINTISGHYAKNQEVEYINDGVKVMMEVYWSVITCIYLAWSFLTFHWYVTWIIWPIAGIVFSVLKNCLRKR